MIGALLLQAGLPSGILIAWLLSSCECKSLPAQGWYPHILSSGWVSPTPLPRLYTHLFKRLQGRYRTSNIKYISPAKSRQLTLKLTYVHLCFQRLTNFSDLPAPSILVDLLSSTRTNFRRLVWWTLQQATIRLHTWSRKFSLTTPSSSKLTYLCSHFNSLDQELDYYVQVLSKGMNGPLNYYRTTKHRHEEELGEWHVVNLPYLVLIPSSCRPSLQPSSRLTRPFYVGNSGFYGYTYSHPKLRKVHFKTSRCRSGGQGPLDHGGS